MKEHVMKKVRKQFGPAEKISVLREHLLDGVAVSEVCRQRGVKPSMFYRWQKQLFENGEAAFTQKRAGIIEKSLTHKIDLLDEKLKRKDAVIAEIMEEHVALKKEFGEA